MFLFLLLVGVTALAGWLSWTRAEETVLGWRTAYAPFLLLLGGWLICLTLHQYVRSLLAYRGGGPGAARQRLPGKLNPFAFRELGAQVVLPGRVPAARHVRAQRPRRARDRSAVTRPFRVLAALGGLATNVVLAAVLAVTVALLVPAGQVTNNWAIGAVMFLCFLNVSAALLALLPVPGTVGYDILTEAVNRWRPRPATRRSSARCCCSLPCGARRSTPCSWRGCSPCSV